MCRGEKVTRFSLNARIWMSRGEGKTPYSIMMRIGSKVESAVRDTVPAEKAQESRVK
jgi:hypothetical protein